MLIDCGAAVSVIDKSVFDSAVPKAEQVVPKGVPGKIAANDVSLPIGMTKNLQAGGMSFGNRPVAIYDFSRANEFARRFGSYTPNPHIVVDGLIGFDILRSHNAIIDTTHQVVHFDPSRSKRGGRLSENMRRFGFTRVQMTLDRHGNLLVPCTVNSKTGQLVVDTGAHISQLNYRFASAAGVSLRPSSTVTHGIPIKMGLGVGNSGSTEIFIAEPQLFKVGEYQYPRGPIGCLQHQFATDGFLGPDMLEKGHAFLDFGNNCLFLK
jgi:hypothetical protein